MLGKRFRFDNLPQDLQEAQAALKQAQEWLNADFDLLILDEINTAVKTELLSTPEILALIKQRPKHLELVLTGRYCPPEVMELADLITDLRASKHYFDQGLDARRGIEY
jgi:cob(I)alamin adenosyltransferase